MPETDQLEQIETRKPTKRNAREKRNLLLKRIKDEDLSLSDVAQSVLQDVVVKYLSVAWFVFMNRRVYDNRVQTLLDLMDAIETAIDQESDLFLLSTLKASINEHIQPRKFQRLMKEVYLLSALGRKNTIVRDSNGIELSLVGGFDQLLTEIVKPSPSSSSFKVAVEAPKSVEAELKSVIKKMEKQIEQLESAVVQQQTAKNKLEQDVSKLMLKIIAQQNQLKSGLVVSVDDAISSTSSEADHTKSTIKL